MRISENGIRLIKSFEGCYLKAYKCPAGVWTIGWGTTEEVDGKKPCEGMVITQEQADNLLINHLKAYERAVDRLPVELNQNQFDALTSFCYNLGTGIFRGRLLEAIKQEDWGNVAKQLLLYNRGGGVVLKGLARRRQAESDLFLKSIAVVVEKPPHDEILYQACRKLILSEIFVDINQWKRTDLIKLDNVEALICKLGGIDELVEKGIISNKELWEYKNYSVDNVRSLIIKYVESLD